VVFRQELAADAPDQAAGMVGARYVFFFCPLLESLRACVLLAAAPPADPSTTYGDGKVANREMRVWHGATENVP
jgi:hypothetical protein